MTGIIKSWHNRGTRGKSSNITADHYIGWLKDSMISVILSHRSLLVFGEYAQRQTDKSAPVGLIMLKVCGRN